MLVVVASYRQNVHAYPSGGGDYEVATVNLGPKAGLTVAQRAARRLRPDRRGVDLLRRAERRGRPRRSSAGTRRSSRSALVVLLTAMNLRGVRESGAAFAVPTTCSWSASSAWPSSASSGSSTGTPAAGRERRARRSSPSPSYEALGGLALVVPAAARLLLRLCGPDRRRGHQQRRAGLQEAQEQERRHDAAADGLHRRSPCCCR